MKLVLATRNKDKITEIKALLQNLHIEIYTFDDFEYFPDVVEDRNTLEGNAEKKAREIYNITGMPAMADDTGLFVDALDGEPGVFSSRYAGEHVTYEDNRKKLLMEMKDIPADKREAFFKTAIVLILSEDKKFIVEGRCDGYIGFEEKGTMGFGYDPIFYLHDSGKSFAELTVEEKNRISHRGRALQKMKKVIEKLTK